MYEAKHQPLLARAHFYQRVAAHVFVACGLIVASLCVGMAGYMLTERMSVLDAFLNAAMLLGGMGPVGTLTTTAGKIFAGVFALYSGLVFVASAALVLTPLIHRVLHRFHVDEAP